MTPHSIAVFVGDLVVAAFVCGLVAGALCVALGEVISDKPWRKK